MEPTTYGTEILKWTALIGCYTLVVGSYIAVIALYVWVFKQMDEMKRTFHSHELLDGRHTPVQDLVRKGDCDGRFALLQVELSTQKEDIAETRKSVEQINQRLDHGFDRVVKAVEQLAVSRKVFEDGKNEDAE